MKTSLTAFPLVLTAAAAVVSLPAPDAAAVPIVTSDDTWVAGNEISGASATIRGLATKLSVAEGDSNTRRTSILRYVLGGATGVSAGSSVSISLDGQTGTGAGPYTFRLYGVLDGVVEDNLNEATYSAASAQAVDTSGNGVNELFVFGGSPLATTVDATGTNGTTISFSGATLDSFLSTVTGSVLDDDAAFLVTVDATNDVFKRFDLTSRNGGNFTPPTLDLVVPVPEPATLALAGAGGLVMLRRRGS